MYELNIQTKMSFVNMPLDFLTNVGLTKRTQSSEIAFSQMQSVVRKVKFLMLIFGHVLIRIFGR